MEEAVGDLVLNPFRDIVAQANVALANATEGGHEPMLRAAQLLAKEGDRALKRIEPLCRKHFDDAGPYFVDALKDNAEISRFSEDLADLLYDFEDYVEVDGFDPDKFAELQALSRRAAPRIVHIITRMKLEPARARSDSTAGTPAPASPASQHGQLGRPRGADPVGPVAQNAVGGSAAPPLPGGFPDDAAGGSDGASDPLGVMGFQSGPDTGLESAPAQHHRGSSAGTAAAVSPMPLIEELPPEEPPQDAWDRATRVPGAAGNDGEAPVVLEERRECIADPATYESASASPVQGARTPQPRRLDEGVAFLEEQERQARAADAGALKPEGRQTLGAGHEHAGPANMPAARASASSARPTSLPPYEAVSPVSPGHRPAPIDDPTAGTVSASFGSTLAPAPAPAPTPSAVQALAELLQDIDASQPTGLEAVRPEIPDGLMPVEDGLIPVDEGPAGAAAREAETTPWREPDCTIKLSSSFYQFKGFCEGAREVIRGEPGVKKIRKQGLSMGATEVAKCKKCPYELEWKQVERDVNNEDSGNYRSSGVSFRVRFLSKSHIPARTIEDQIYGCLFCIHEGRTVEESDATVFFGQKALFAHLARHPRPLPSVPGVTAVETREMPARHRNNYDVWFAQPPAPSQMTAIRREVSQQPAAAAVETFKQSLVRGIRRPPDGHRVLQFPVGARIVGVEFPARYGGQWCTGWSDNEWAAFPADLVRLEPPAPAQIRVQGASNMRAVARWRWSPKAKGRDRDRDQAQWLRFDKGDTITGIGWSYPGHWCWSGTNAKGQWGIFPRSHLDPDSLAETPVGSDRASIASSSENRRSSLFPRVALRGRSDSGSGSSTHNAAAGAGAPGPSSPRASFV